MKIGDNIKKRRIELELTQEEVASYLSTTKQTIHKYEMGVVTNIPTDKIEKLAEILKTTPTDLMGWKKATAGLPQLDIEIAKLYSQANDEQKKKIIEYATFLSLKK